MRRLRVDRVVWAALHQRNKIERRLDSGRGTSELGKRYASQVGFLA